MKLFIKLALVAAVATSGSAFAIQSMGDAELAETTGQDGITLTITTPASGFTIDQIALFDRGGFDEIKESGAIVLGKHAARGAALGADPSADTRTPFNFDMGGGAIEVRIDSSGGGSGASDTTGAAPLIDVGISLPKKLIITTGDITVVGAQGAAGAQKVDTATNSAVASVMNSMTIDLSGNALMHVQLGNATQSGMILVSGVLPNGLNITNIQIVDKMKGGVLGVAGMKVTGGLAAYSTTNLFLGSRIDVLDGSGFNSQMGTGGTAAGGLIISPGRFVKNNIYLTGVSLGVPIPAGTVGDIGITGLNMTGVKVGIQGHI